MGHVDHGKSAILDYIRKTNVVANEAGGITQHVSAYEVEHNYEGDVRKITFLDTPGHEAFREIRRRGASVADIAILVVAADDGVKTQTLDALSAIKDADIPFVVAINKIDKPEANVQKVQSELIENEIYIEGMGGDVPWVQLSAKTGEGVDDLLNTILLLSDMLDLKADESLSATGVVIETGKDPKRGISATVIIKNGTLRSGEFVVAENAWAPVRIFEDFKGVSIKSATFSSPVKIVGFNIDPLVGAEFSSVSSKKEAEALASATSIQNEDVSLDEMPEHAVPVVVKADTLGSKEAILYELNKLQNDRAYFKVLKSGVGDISKDDAEMALSANALILGFHVKVDKSAAEIIRQNSLNAEVFDIIYNLTDFAKKYLQESTPKTKVKEQIGVVKVIKIFSESNKGYVLGGKVESGVIKLGATVEIDRRNTYLGEGIIKTLQSNKQDVEKVEEGSMYGALVETQIPLAEGDSLKIVEEVIK